MPINTKPRVFLDMDGFLVNFTKALCKLLKIPYTNERSYGYDFWKQSGMSEEKFRDAIRQDVKWWAALEPHHYAKDFIHWLIKQRIDWYILSSAMYDNGCYAGKVQWVRRCMGNEGMQRLILMFSDEGVSADKGTIARPGDILVDDGPHNWDTWDRAGGEAFPWMEYAYGHKDLEPQLARLKNFIALRTVGVT